MSSSVLLMFSSKSFIVSALTFMSLIHCEFIFVYGVQTLFLGAPKSLQMVTAAMKLKDAYSMEERL